MSAPACFRYCARAILAISVLLASSAQAGAQAPPDSEVIVALMRNAVANLPPRDAALRRAPWRVEVSDSSSRAWRLVAAGVEAAIARRTVSRQDTVQAVMTLGEYTHSDGVHRLSFDVITMGRCGTSWRRAWAYITWYEVEARRASKDWAFMPLREVAHGDPTICLDRPDLGVDGRPRTRASRSARHDGR
ncbi:MAG TPA: hypothetical protein VN428_16755 [Bryobacteraceae bacterium]|nr:hypothetical protein [Bryobacteraceae bacterium]